MNFEQSIKDFERISPEDIFTLETLPDIKNFREKEFKPSPHGMLLFGILSKTSYSYDKVLKSKYQKEMLHQFNIHELKILNRFTNSDMLTVRDNDSKNK